MLGGIGLSMPLMMSERDLLISVSQSLEKAHNQFLAYVALLPKIRLIATPGLPKPSGIFSRSYENRTNCKQNLIIFPEYLILTFVMFVRTTLRSSKLYSMRM